MTFESLGLITEIKRAVTEQGYSKPTPIQKQAIPIILEGQDIMASAQTGTGKTAGFTLPILQRLSKRTKNTGRSVIRALILTPTRELAMQVAESIHLYGKYLPLKSTAIYGGVNIRPQIQKLRHGVDILIATPGRLLDHFNQKTLDLSHVEILVLDEADRMLDMGFIGDVKKIASLTPKNRQSLLFSATLSKEIKTLAASLLHSPASVEIAPHKETAELISQVAHFVDKKRKRELLSFLISSKRWNRVLIFMRTKHSADRLAEQLIEDGINAGVIHGSKKQGSRTKALANFKKGVTQALVSTDVAARGLDIDFLPYVVNFDLPYVPGDYIHRIGRTGRAGNKGEAISLVSIDERNLLKNIERLLKHEIPKVIVPGFEPNPSVKAESSDIQHRPKNRHSRKAFGGKRHRRKQGFGSER